MTIATRWTRLQRRRTRRELRKDLHSRRRRTSHVASRPYGFARERCAPRRERSPRPAEGIHRSARTALCAAGSQDRTLRGLACRRFLRRVLLLLLPASAAEPYGSDGVI